MDDTRHVSQDQYNDIILQLEELTESKSDDKTEDIKRCARTILDILCLDIAEV